MDDLKSIIGKVATGATLSRAEAASAFDSLMSGEATPSQMGGRLMALRVRGETGDEITGAVSAMRAKMLRVSAPADAVDVVGTGGDGSGSVNVSTCASFIVAGAGVPVAKHGNRALSSRSGAADVLGALGVKIDLRPDDLDRQTFRSGGPGGQHQNKTESGVRYIHLPTGIAAEPGKYVGSVDEFVSRWQEHSEAYAIMTPKVYENLRQRGLPGRVLARDSRRVILARR